MKSSIAIILNYLIWGVILGFITGINVSIFINFYSPPLTSSINVFQFVFDHVLNWTLNGLYVSGFFGGLYLVCRPRKVKNNDPIN